MLAPKRFLFVVRHPPYSGMRPQETLDMLLTTAAIDQIVRALFLDDGVFQLILAQQPEVIDHPNLAATFKAFELYDVEGIWAETESLDERGLRASQLLAGVQLIRRDQVAQFLANHDVVVGS